MHSHRQETGTRFVVEMVNSRKAFYQFARNERNVSVIVPSNFMILRTSGGIITRYFDTISRNNSLLESNFIYYNATTKADSYDIVLHIVRLYLTKYQPIGPRCPGSMTNRPSLSTQVIASLTSILFRSNFYSDATQQYVPLEHCTMLLPRFTVYLMLM